jgi:GT2 family glycosyltransferase
MEREQEHGGRVTTICVVTPWLEHRDLERDYWAALRGEDCQVIVVDNGSDPALPNAWRLDHNSGFSHACNVGLELASTDAVLFLNNDIVANAAGWLAPIRDALEPGVLVGANIRDEPHAAVDGQRLPYIDGWCLAGMRDDLLELGGFDEGYAEPAYYGDNDLCLRARAAGMVLREARTGLRHKGGQTAGVNPDSSANRARFEERARDLIGAAACAA